jgi:hypothetical protein
MKKTYSRRAVRLGCHDALIAHDGRSGKLFCSVVVHSKNHLFVVVFVAVFSISFLTFMRMNENE